MTESEANEVSSTLSKSQREWLRGDDDALGSPDRVVRSRIKKRVAQGISDLGLVHRTDRLDAEDMMRSVRDESSSTSEAGQEASSGGVMDEEIQPDAFDGAIKLLEMASGTKIEDYNLSDTISQIRRVKGQHGHLDDETVQMFMAAGAMAGLMGTGKTEKQARQWVEHHWPESDEVQEQWEEASQLVDD